MSVGLAVRGVRRAWWRVPPLLPLAVLVFLPQLLGVVFAGRQGTFTQVRYVWPGLVVALGVTALAGLAVVVARVASGRRDRDREESGETTGVTRWDSASR